jgi:putative tryptophan/tyrosine transport system substrate-binding protein
MRRHWILALAFMIFTTPAVSQSGSGPTRSIGYLSIGPGPTDQSRAFVEGLHALGYVEGRNLRILYRWAEGNSERLPALAADLVAQRVDLILGSGTPASLAAKAATTTIPIVVIVGDALDTGLVTNLARPGGNLTGHSVLGLELSGKRLELLKEAVPDLTRVAILWNARNPQSPGRFNETETAARALGIDVVSLDIRFPEGIEDGFTRAVRENAHAVLILSDGSTLAHRHALGAASRAHRLPTMFGNRTYLEGGGLMSYGTDLRNVSREAARYVDMIWKGTKPGDLPVAQPSKFELIVNGATVRALALELPPNFQARVDEVIE